MFISFLLWEDSRISIPLAVDALLFSTRFLTFQVDGLAVLFFCFPGCSCHMLFEELCPNQTLIMTGVFSLEALQAGTSRQLELESASLNG